MEEIKITIEKIAMLHGIATIKQKGGQTFAVCPFCGDNKMRFSYASERHGKKNMFNCFRCGAHGSGFELHERLSGKSFESNKEIAKDILSSLSGRDIKGTSYVPAVREADKASDEIISKVFYHMLSILPLKEEHRADLKRRGLTEADIKRFRIRSTPQDAEAFATEMYRWAKHEGISLEGIPGFYKRKNCWAFTSAQGYICPVFKGNLIIGAQVRVDEPKKGGKYLWISSADRESGTSSGAPATFLTGKNKKLVIVTEGILKALVIYCLLGGEFCVAGVPGVNSTAGLNYILKEWGDAFYVEAFDMDKMYTAPQIPLLREAVEEASKRGAKSFSEIFMYPDTREKYKEIAKVYRIATAAENLCKKIEDSGAKVHPLTWDVKDGDWKGTYKGLDDFLLEYPETEKFKAYIRQKAEKIMSLQVFLS